MDITFIIFTTVFISCLLGTFISLSLLNKKTKSDGRILIVPTLICTAICVATAYFFNQFSDFITPFSLKSFLLPPLAVFLMAATGWLPKRQWFQTIVIMASICGTLYFFPEYRNAFTFHIPESANTVLTALFWLVATFSLRIFAKFPNIFFLNSSTFFIGLFILSVIGGVPAMVGLFGIGMGIGNLISFSHSNNNPQKLLPDDTNIAGYLCGWLSIVATAENAGPCIICLWSFILIEFIWAWGKKLTFIAAYNDISRNTVSAQAVAEGLAPQILNSFLIRVFLILLMFSGLEVFAPNFYTLPSVCLLLTVWNLYRLHNWQTPDKTIKQTNKEVFEKIKNGAETLKDNFIRKE